MMKRYWFEIVITVSAFVVLNLLPWWQGITGKILLHLVVSLFVIFFGVLFVLWAIHKEIRILSSQYQRTDEKLRKPLAEFCRFKLTKLQDVRDALTSKEGHYLKLGDLERLVAACFAVNRGNSYVGTDSNVPTQFYRLYRTYLDQHFGTNRSNNPSRRDVRILFASETDLRADYASDKQVFQDFYYSHIKYDVVLLQVEKNDAKKFASDLPSSDLGIWNGEFVVFFTPICRRGTPIGYRIYLETVHDERQRQLREYMRRLNQNAKEIRLENDLVPCVSRTPDDVQQLEKDRLLWSLNRNST